MYVCGVPRGSAAFEQIIRVEQRVFGKNSVPPHVARVIFRRRPETVSAVFDPHGAVAAYVHVFPLKHGSAEQFVDGAIAEPDFTPELVLDRCDDHDGCYLYLASVVIVRKCDPIMKMLLLSNLLACQVRHLRSLSLTRATVIMTAATGQGRRLAEMLAARKIRDGRGRKDGLDLFAREITPAALDGFVGKVEHLLTQRVVRVDPALEESRAT